MEEQIHSVLNELEEFGRRNDALETNHARKMLNLDRETAELASILARSSRARSVLEIGTSNGYSTIWLAWSVQTHGGRMVTIDRSPEKQRMARENLSRAGLLNIVDLVLGDATEIVSRLAGPFDFLFFDADRVSAPKQLEVLLPKLSPVALILADNILSHAAEVAAYLSIVEHLPNVISTVVPIGKGLSIVHRNAERRSVSNPT